MQIFNNPSIPHRSVHSFWGVEWRLVLRHAYIGNFQEASFNKDWGFIQCIFTLAWYTVFLMGLEWCTFTSFNVSFTFLSKKNIYISFTLACRVSFTSVTGCWVVSGYFLWLNCVVFCSELKGRQTSVVLNKENRDWKNLGKFQIPLIFQFLLFVKFERKN